MKPHHARRGIALLAALALLTVVSAGPAPADTGPLPVDPALYVSFSDGPFLVDWNGGFRARVRVYGHVTGKARVKLSISDAGGAKELGISPAQVTVTPIGTDFDFPVLVTGKLARRQEAGAFEVEATLLPRIGDPVEKDLVGNVPPVHEPFTLSVTQTAWSAADGAWNMRLSAVFSTNTDVCRIPPSQITVHFDIDGLHASGSCTPSSITGATSFSRNIVASGDYDQDAPNDVRCFIIYRAHVYDPVADDLIVGTDIQQKITIDPDRNG